MNHTHSYRFWHAHLHRHADESKGVGGWEPETGERYVIYHDAGHYHLWAQAHDHGEKSHLAPHTHQARQAHPGEKYVHHHAVEDHEKEA